MSFRQSGRLWTWDRRHARWLGEKQPASQFSSWQPVLLSRRGKWVGAASGTVIGEFETKYEAASAVERWMAKSKETLCDPK